MIVEIETPKDSCTLALDYNEGKVDRGVAELIAAHGVPNLEREAIYELFARYERSQVYPVREVSFHASVNPSEADQCNEEDIIRFVAELMEAIGLGNQPYLVYRHFDIDRIHYHIVSIRIDESGHKINNYYEIKKASAFIRTVADKYHFHVVSKGEHVMSKRNISKNEGKQKQHSFSSQKGDTDSQLKEVFSYALTYDFDGFSQFACIMRDLGVNVEQVRDSNEDGMILTLQGLYETGRPCTKIRTERELGVPMSEQLATAAVANKQSHHIRRREKDRLSGLVSAAFKYSKSEAHFENILRNKGVGVHLSKTSSGEVFGVTFVDHLTRCVFKASEMPGVISVDMMREAVDSGHWRALDRGSSRNSYIREKRDESREAAQTLRNINEGIVTRILKPVGQPKGNSWNNKTKKTKEQLKEEFELDRSGAADVSFEDKTYDERLA